MRQDWSLAPRPAWRVEKCCIVWGEVWLLLAPPTGIFAFVVRNLDFHAMGRFDSRDGGLGLTWLEKCEGRPNKQLSVGGRIFDSTRAVLCHSDASM